MCVKQFCTRDVDVCRPAESAQRAAQLMRDRNVGMLVVCDDIDLPVGVLTDRDLAVRVAATGADAARVPIRDVMTQKVIRVNENASLFLALQEMRSGVCRRLLVVNSSGALVGVLSLDDVLTWLTGEFDEINTLIQQEGPNSLANVAPPVGRCHEHPTNSVPR